jgi:hypothetical protein
LLNCYELCEGKNIAFGPPFRYFLWFPRHAFSACVRVDCTSAFQGEHGEER